MRYRNGNPCAGCASRGAGPKLLVCDIDAFSRTSILWGWSEWLEHAGTSSSGLCGSLLLQGAAEILWLVWPREEEAEREASLQPTAPHERSRGTALIFALSVMRLREWPGAASGVTQVGCWEDVFHQRVIRPQNRLPGQWA